MAKELPGFYYDEQKGKYFRIQQAHKVVGGVGYTKQGVKAAKQAKREHERSQQQAQRYRTGTVKRSSLLHRNTSHISTRTGARFSQTKADIVREYGAGLRRQALCTSNLETDEILQEGSEFLPSAGFTAANFSLAPSGSLCTTYKRSGLHTHASWTEIVLAKPTYRYRQHSADSFSLDERCLRFCGYPIELCSSLTNNEGQDHAIVVCGPTSQVSVRQPFPRHHSSGDVDVSYTINTPGMGIEVIWDIASAPSKPTAALATNEGLVLVDCTLFQLDAVNTRTFGYLCGPSKEQMNVCFKDNNIVMSGERSGRINFTDIRLKQNRGILAGNDVNEDDYDRKNSSVVRLLHSSAVLATQALHHDNHVLVHGFSTTDVYDLRFVSKVPIRSNRRKPHRDSQSRPYLRFSVPRDRHTDHYTKGRKLAHSSDLDLVAAVSSNTSNILRPPPSLTIPTPTSQEKARRITRNYNVTLYSSRTGKLVESLLTAHAFDEEVRCVDIKRTRDGPESVFCLSGNQLDEWVFQGGGGDYDEGEDGSHLLDHTGNEEISGSDFRELSAQQEWDRGNRKLNV